MGSLFNVSSFLSFVLFCIFVASEFFNIIESSLQTRTGRLVLVEANQSRHEITSFQCKAGIYILSPRSIPCICITGVWGFYGKYCEDPLFFIGGLNFCFKTSIEVSQLILIGNPTNPLKSTLIHFREDFRILTRAFTGSTQYLALDPVATSFMIIGNSSWELLSNSKERICLVPRMGPGPADPNGNESVLPYFDNPKDQFCQVTTQDWKSFIMDKGWMFVIGVQKNCTDGTPLLMSSSCQIISIGEDKECQGDIPEIDVTTLANRTVIPAPISTSPLNNDTTTTPKPNTSSPNVTEGPGVENTPTTIDPNSGNPNVTKDNDTTPDGNTTKPDKGRDSEFCERSLIDRSQVNQFWKPPPGAAEKTCGANANDSGHAYIFKSQLQRVAEEEMKVTLHPRPQTSKHWIPTPIYKVITILKLMSKVLLRSCPEDTIPVEHLQTSISVFQMFLAEDLGSGVTDIKLDRFEGFLVTLRKCSRSILPFDFETRNSNETNCTLHKEITGKVNIQPLNPDSEVQLPEDDRILEFEPIIETIWQIFINSYSACYQYFSSPNLHHFLVTVMVKLFVWPIYDKWTMSTIDDLDIYKYIFPDIKILKSTLRNIGYCVRARQKVSLYPPALHRNSTNPNWGLGGATPVGMRHKRSIWATKIQEARNQTRIWNGTAHCLQDPEEPGHLLGFGKCSFPLDR